jgi:ribosomal protein L11
MKKKYGLESIIGKKSKLRFPRLLYLNKVELLTFVLPANSAIAQPPLSTSITFKKGEPFEFCDQFNEASWDQGYEEGLPINVIIYISSLNLLFEIQPPTVYSLFGIIFDFEEINARVFVL